VGGAAPPVADREDLVGGEQPEAGERDRHAEDGADHDARLREAVDARNTLDSAAYQVERRLSELGDQVAVHDKARAQMLLADARQAIKEEAPVDRVRALTADLQQMLHGLAATSGGPSAGTGPAGPGPASGSDDVIDADYSPAG
jgi:molecular chaperone DnaK